MFAAASYAALISAPDHDDFTAFRALQISMEMQFLWSFVLLCVGIHCLRTKRHLNEPGVLMVVTFDWLTAILSMATASASAAVTIYL